jgi:cytochrome c peroxidase
MGGSSLDVFVMLGFKKSISSFTLALSALLLPYQALSVTVTKAPDSLRTVRVPKVPGLLSGVNPIVVDQKAAIALGKAFFWDMNVGSDGMACASCHFEAGVDGRIQNQIGRAEYHAEHNSSTGYSLMGSGRLATIDYRVSSLDFPFTQFVDPSNNASGLKFRSDVVMGSAGSFSRQFISTGLGGEADSCAPNLQSFFRRDGRLTRQVGQRNAPNVINAAFNYRNFWDGRANNAFNGETPWGPRDPKAGVWVQTPDRGVIKERIVLPNSSLASQAVDPIVNSEEMACEGRTHRDVARRILGARPLFKQVIAETDSVLGPLRASDGLGLTENYSSLIRRAFAKRFWGSDDMVEPGVAQIEANFPFIFGLSIQLYESTLVSDQAPFDSPRDSQGYPRDLSPAQRHGQDLFIKNLCIACHAGPTFSLAAYPEVVNKKRNPNGPQLVDRMVINGVVPGAEVRNSVTFAVFDRGFANTSVVPTELDSGLGGLDPFGNPYSFSRQYLDVLEGVRKDMVDPIRVLACDFLAPFTMDYASEELKDDPLVRSPANCRKTRKYSKVPFASVLVGEEQRPGRGRALSMINGSFKIPSLRNVELTGPYMHNGGMKSLNEVLEFYNRAGNFNNQEHFATLVVDLGLSAEDIGDLIAFLSSLTDERVRWEKAPFDHPSLEVPEGRSDQGLSLGQSIAPDRLIHVPAVGREGRSGALGPLQPFDLRLKKNVP